MRRKKVNCTLTFLLAAAVIAGSIHWVAADTNKEVYEAPELTLEAGAQDYDLTKVLSTTVRCMSWRCWIRGTLILTFPGRMK